MLDILHMNLWKIAFNLQDLLSSIVKEGCLTERSCVSAVGTLIHQHITAVRSSPLFLSFSLLFQALSDHSAPRLFSSHLQVQHLVSLLSEVEPKLADIIKKDFSISSNVSS